MNDNTFFKKIFDGLENGILVFDTKGVLTFGNAAAFSLLELRPDSCIGKTHEALFLGEIKNAALDRLISDSLSRKKNQQRQLVPYGTRQGKTVSLSVATRFLSEDAGSIVYLRDTSMISPGAKDGKVLNTKYKQLMHAFHEASEKNRDLERRLKRLEWLKIIVSATLFIIFAAIIFRTGQSTMLPKTPPPDFTTNAAQAQIVAAKRDTMIQAILLSGKIEPYRKETLKAQSSGTIIRKNFHEGQLVENGHILYELDRKELSQQVRSARVTYMELLERFNTLKNWPTSLEVMQALRKFDLSKIALNDERKKLNETKKLFNKGIIARIEYEQAQTAYKRLDYDFQNAKQSLEQIEARGNPEKLEVLRLQLFNAREELDELERQHEAALVRAPVKGIVMRPIDKSGSKFSFKNEGDRVEPGDLMAMIGATESYILSAAVGELSVKDIFNGQQARITNHNLNKIRIDGRVKWVATEAVKDRNLRIFPVQIVIPSVPDSLRDALPIGSLAEAEIKIGEIPNVLTLPVEAVFKYQGSDHICILDSSGGQHLIPVETGYSDTERIIINSGLTAGTSVLIQARAN